MYDLYFSAGVSRWGSMACPPIPFNLITCHSPLCFCLCTLLILQLQALASLVPHSVALLHIPTARAVNFILSSTLLYMRRLIAPPTSICSSHVSTHTPPRWYQEWNVCF